MSTAETPPTDAAVMSAEQLDAERRRGRIAGIAALVAVPLIVASAIWSSKIDQDDTGGKPVIAQPNATGLHAGSNAQAKQKADDQLRDDRDETNALASIDNHIAAFIGSAALNALALLLLFLPAHALYRATRSRNPSEPAIVGVMAVYGPIAIGVAFLIRAFALKHASADFVDQQFTTYAAAADEAHDSQTGTVFMLFEGIAISGLLAFVFWLIKGVWDAQRVGLLPKAYAILGMALPILALIATPIAPPIAMFWMLALGLLLIGRWPGGIPPAWAAGNSTPWPTRSELAARPKAEPEVGGERNGNVKAVGPGVSAAGESRAKRTRSDPQPRKKRKRRG